jgi:hypothetical protein
LRGTQRNHLLSAQDGKKPAALAGYRRIDNLIDGRFIYVDDLMI